MYSYLLFIVVCGSSHQYIFSFLQLILLLWSARLLVAFESGVIDTLPLSNTNSLLNFGATITIIGSSENLSVMNMSWLPDGWFYWHIPICRAFTCIAGLGELEMKFWNLIIKNCFLLHFINNSYLINKESLFSNK